MNSVEVGSGLLPVGYPIPYTVQTPVAMTSSPGTVGPCISPALRPHAAMHSNPGLTARANAPESPEFLSASVATYFPAVTQFPSRPVQSRDLLDPPVETVSATRLRCPSRLFLWALRSHPQSSRRICCIISDAKTCIRNPQHTFPTTKASSSSAASSSTRRCTRSTSYKPSPRNGYPCHVGFTPKKWKYLRRSSSGRRNASTHSSDRGVSRPWAEQRGGSGAEKELR